MIFTACQKEVLDEQTQEVIKTDCRLNESSLYIDSSLYEKATYTYRGDTLASIDVSTGLDTGRYLFEYNSDGNILRRSFYKAAALHVVASYTAVSYNIDGTMRKYETFIKEGANEKLEHLVELDYTAGKLTHVVSSYYNEYEGTMMKDLEYAYRYSGNNLTSVTKTTYNPDNTAVSNGTYDYDSDSSYLARFGLQLLVTDPAFEGVDGDYVPALVSANNPIRLNDIDPGEEEVYTFLYILDDKKNLKRFNVKDESGTVNFTFNYNYSCR
jgi:hypothetical protein